MGNNNSSEIGRNAQAIKTPDAERNAEGAKEVLQGRNHNSSTASEFPLLTRHLYEQITACTHPRTEVRALVIADGRIQHVAQCLRCHQKVGGAVKQTEDVPEFDVANHRRIQMQLEAFRQTAWKESTEQREMANAQWWAEYETYLQSQEWQETRDRILRRAKGICEGCNQRPATQVHHLTYRHVRAEFDNELVAYCRHCHDRIHEQGDRHEP